MIVFRYRGHDTLRGPVEPVTDEDLHGFRAKDQLPPVLIMVAIYPTVQRNSSKHMSFGVTIS